MRCSLKAGWVYMLSFMLGLSDIIPAKWSTFLYCLVADRWVAFQFPLVSLPLSRRKWGTAFLFLRQSVSSAPLGPVDTKEEDAEVGRGGSRIPSSPDSWHLLLPHWCWLRVKVLPLGVGGRMEGEMGSQDQPCFALSHCDSLMPGGEWKIAYYSTSPAPPRRGIRMSHLFMYLGIIY